MEHVECDLALWEEVWLATAIGKGFSFVQDYLVAKKSAPLHYPMLLLGKWL